MPVPLIPTKLFRDHLFLFLFLVLGAVAVHRSCTFSSTGFLLLLAGESLAISLIFRAGKIKDIFSGACLFFLLLFYFAHHPGFPLSSPFLLSAKFVEKVDSFKDMEVYGFVKSLVTGNRNVLSAALKDLFSRTGSYHLIAISGLHFGMAATLFLIPLSSLAKKKRLFILFLLLTLYLFLTRFYVSAFRAYLMICYGLAAASRSFRIQPLNAWAFATTVILLLQPYQISSLSFWLSVLATFGILVSLPILGLIRWSPFKAMAVSVMAQLPIIPLIGLYFHKVNILSPVLSLFALVLLYPMILLGFFLLLPLPSFLASLIVAAEEGLSVIFLRFLTLFDNNWNCLTVHFSREGALIYWGAYLMSLAGVFIYIQKRGRRRQKRGDGHYA